jgi:2-polyprenyl-3-methyl-5-hydroxy-6-metoxy-1,4-benzoquinol methylase
MPLRSFAAGICVELVAVGNKATMRSDSRNKVKVLVAIASHGTRNDRFLAQVVNEYRSMSYSVDLIMLSNVHKEADWDIEVIVGLPNKNPRSLPFGHKRIFADRINDYDLFIYSEDDILISEKNIDAFLNVTEVLPEDELAGFMRSETANDGTKYFCDVHGPFHWDPASVRQRKDYTLAHFTNDHSACFALTRRQLQRAISSGRFLVGPHDGKYDLLEAAATDPYTQCGFKKLIPISHFDDFVIPHLPNKYIGKLGLKESAFHRQIETLLNIGKNSVAPYCLFETETKLAGAAYSKDYYEPVSLDVISAIPDGARSVLSIGCGWGATEACLAKRGLRVVAIPMDPVIAGMAEVEGVRIVQGDFRRARKKLEGERFDSLLMSNVLQFVKDPAETLSCFASLLKSDAVAVAVVPNFMRVTNVPKRILGTGHYKDLEGYEKTAVHPTSRPIIRKWFRDAGLRNEKVIDVLSGRAQKASRLTLGLADRFFASEFIAVARRG